jgi:uroporphyrinogen decarboxylase
MTPRERVWRAIHRQCPDKVPKEAGFTPEVLRRFQQETGGTSPADTFGMEARSVGFRPLRPEDFPDFSAYLREMPPNARIASEYGTATVSANYYHFWGYVFPLRQAETVAETERYPWPDATLAYRHEELERQVAELHRQGYFVDGFAGHLFETSWQLVGFEKMFVAMVENPALVEAVLDRITDDACFRARRFAEAGVDMLRTGDDVAMEHQMMMHPRLWRRFLKPRLARVIAAAREVQPELPVWYHSDGNVLAILDELIEVGVTVLNPVQPESMDLEELQRRYGDRIAFWGAVGTQSVMPFGTPAEVRREVKRLIDLFAPGLVLAPTHVLEPDVPWENIVAFFDAVEEYGQLA